MTIELRVPGRAQTSPMSCWWACMAMILHYYSRDYTYPWDFNEAFRRPLHRGVRSGLPDVRTPTVGTAMAHDPTLRRTSELVYNEPYEWYEYGLPRNRHAFQLLSELTGFMGFDRPAFGSWTADDVESRLRTYGPYAFFGFWNGFPHAIVVVGMLTVAGTPTVVTLDPARGFATNVDLETFNSTMDTRMREFNFNRLNPLYYPTGEPVRDTV